MALRGNELLVIEVKSRKPEALRNLNHLARAVASVPNARLEVYWLGDEPEANLTRGRVHMYVDEARTLLRIGHSTAAALIAWAAVEGALIYYAANLQVPLPEHMDYIKLPWQLLSYLDSLGHINEADLKRLTELRKQRNAAAHFVGQADPNPADIEYCLDIVDRMLSGRYVSVDQMMEWFVEHHDYPDVPVRDADRDRIQALLTEHFPGAPESDTAAVVTRIVHDAAI